MGLALSGGGAKGLAHIGVLKVIEKSGLHIDYVVGTSMGSIIGMLYAIGYSADSIEKIALTEKWDRLLSNDIDLLRIAIEEKSEFGKYIGEFPYYNKSLHLPSGVIDGQELSNELTRLTLPVHDIKDFSQFPKPFKCVATDMLTGQVVLIENGNIVDAVRASMAIPTVFTPVQMNGRLLVDGGLVRNFPVNYLKQMGADILIGVNLSQSITEEHLSSFVDVLSQVMFLGDLDDTEKQKKLCDILIQPDLSGYGPSSFNSADSLIKRGYDGAMKQLDTLISVARAIGLRTDTSAPLPIYKMKSYDSLYITKIEVLGLEKAQPSLIKGKMDIREKTWVDPSSIPYRIGIAYGTRYFNKITYEFVKDANGVKLLLRAKENHLNHFKFAINYNTFTKASLIVNFTARDLLIKNSRMLATISISDNLRFRSEYYKYLGAHRNYGLNLSFYFDRTDFPMYKGAARDAVYVRNFIGVDGRVQRVTGNASFFALGVRSELSSLTYDIISPAFPYDGRNHSYTGYLQYNKNHLDRVYFPTRGTRTIAEIGHVLDATYAVYYYTRDSITNVVKPAPLSSSGFSTSTDKSYFVFQLFSEHNIPLNKRLTLINWNVAGSMFNLEGTTINNPFNKFLVGGPYRNFRYQAPFIGFMDYQLMTNNYLGTLLGFQYELQRNVLLIARGNLLNYNSNVERYLDYKTFIDERNYILGYGLTGGYMSFLGPLELTLMRDETNNVLGFYVNLGFQF